MQIIVDLDHNPKNLTLGEIARLIKVRSGKEVVILYIPKEPPILVIVEGTVEDIQQLRACAIPAKERVPIKRKK